MRPMPSLPVSSVSAWHISSACARLSSAQGPAIRVTGRSLPIVRLPIRTWRALAMAASLNEARLRQCRADEGYEERVWLEQPGFELRVKLHTDEPGVIRD